MRLVLLVAFISQVVGIAALVAYISFRNGQDAVNAVAQRLRSDQSEQIRQHLESFLQYPIRINRSASYFIQSNGLSSGDVPTLQENFLREVRNHEEITSVYFGAASGGIVGSGREGSGGPYYVYSTSRLEPGTFEKYAVDPSGKTGELLSRVPNFDARLRPWYQQALQVEQPTWSEIYILFTGQDMAIAASSAVHDQEGNLLGVLSVDIFLSHLSTFLESLAVSKTGQSFIVERDGLLVAASSGEPLFADGKDGGKMLRIKASESTTPIINSAAREITKQVGSFNDIQEAVHIEYKLDGERYFAHVLPIQDKYGIDWLIVVVVPESDYMAPIETASQYTVFIVLTAALLSVVLSLYASYRINRPIRRLIVSMEAISNGEWGDVNAGWTRIFEIQQLAAAFNRMWHALRESMERLSEEIRHRKQVELFLRESEDRYRTLVENVPVGVFRTTIDGRIVAVNSAYRSMLGLDETDELVHVDLNDFYQNPQDRQKLLDELQANGSVSNMEILFKKKGEGYFWGSVTARATMDADGKVQYLDGMVEDITERKHNQENLKYMATHDGLTGIANRTLFEDRLFHAVETSQRTGQKFAVLFLDLDDFKKVNDEFGHAQGDWLLKQVALRISRVIRASDSVARLGGDEFVLLLEGLSEVAHILPIIQKIQGVIAEPFFLNDHEIRVLASIGVSIYPDNGLDPTVILQKADASMYEVKQSGKNNFHFFR